MNKHLLLVRDFNERFAIHQADENSDAHLSDMDVIMRQALLMARGSEALIAFKSGDMAKILLGLTDLAHCALSAIAQKGGDVVEQPVMWRHDGSVVSIMRLLSEKIHHCASADRTHYSDVYCACHHLVNSFLNADFDKAFEELHETYMSAQTVEGQPLHCEQCETLKGKPEPAPDLSECLYE